MSKILIADDEAHIREILRVYFIKEGFEVIEAEDGQQALLKVEKESPNIVLLDIMMPVMDGITACEEIRRRFDIPIIMLTAKDEDDDRILGLEKGADDYITKPFNPREVVARIKAVLRRSGGFQKLNDKRKLNFDGLSIDREPDFPGRGAAADGCHPERIGIGTARHVADCREKWGGAEGAGLWRSLESIHRPGGPSRHTDHLYACDGDPLPALQVDGRKRYRRNPFERRRN